MRDPASAEFRNENIRTLWTAGGKRVRLYCAEVNGANAYGGKTGFLPLRYIISTKNTKGSYDFALSSDPLWIEEEMTNDHYLDCVRSDTQRGDSQFEQAFIGDFDRNMVDKEEPVLSQDVAPEER
jgi:hypothetical protein